MSNAEQLARGLASRLADFKVSDESIAKAIERLGGDERFNPLDVDVCTKGICTDHMLSTADDLADLLRLIGPQSGVGGVKIFPKGIVAPEHFLVQIEHIAERG